MSSVRTNARHTNDPYADADLEEEKQILDAMQQQQRRIKGIILSEHPSMQQSNSMNVRQSQSSRQYQADAEEDGDDSEEESGDNLS